MILDAAAELVAERGFGGVRIDEVAKGVLYLRFTGPTRRLSALAVFE
ncbi:TetR family transcriptional regulator [Streptosporangium sp. NPDC002607]